VAGNIFSYVIAEIYAARKQVAQLTLFRDSCKFAGFLNFFISHLFPFLHLQMLEAMTG